MSPEARLDAGTLARLDRLTDGVPYTHPPVCHLLYRLVRGIDRPRVVEVSCAYGKATAYLAAAAAERHGSVRAMDLVEHRWQDRTARQVVADADPTGCCQIDLGVDARWWLLDLLAESPDQWIDLAYLDATHTVEVDAFLASTLWRHIRPGGLLIVDDLDWVPRTHGDPATEYSRPDRSHVRALFDYLAELDDVAESLEWGRDRVGWSWGFVRKAGGTEASLAEMIAAAAPAKPRRSWRDVLRALRSRKRPR
ncbi:MAG: class I SAM-dependent methyltransferase [Thermoleophilaceae bacterium]|nr:class I SAM-dependent methyltransferase [Thermoleophilaceae bacterium]